jgi:hypothetical protein
MIRFLAVHATIVAVLACGTVAVSDASAAPYVPQPRAGVVIFPGALQIVRFDAHAHRRHGRVQISVTLNARAREHVVHAVIRIGRCTGGPASFPHCAPTKSRAVTIHAGKTTIRQVDATVRRPAKRTDAIRISVTASGKHVISDENPHGAYADMLLPASAWTRLFLHTFGVFIARPWEGDGLPDDVNALSARAAQKDHKTLRTKLTWTAAAPSPATVQTIAGPCTAVVLCTMLTQQTAIPATGQATFAANPTFTRLPSPRLPIMSYSASVPDGQLFNVTLPWPR